MVNKHLERLNPKKINLINLVSFLLGFSSALTAYVVSSYFKEISGENNVSIFYVIIYFIILIALLNLYKIIKRAGTEKTFFISILFFAGSAWLLSFLPTSSAGVIVLMINIIAATLCFTVKDIILESCSTDRLSGRIRGWHLTLMNLGFILAPFISMQILAKYNFKGVFLLQFIAVAITIFLAYFGLKRMGNKKNQVSPERFQALGIEKIKKNRDVMRIYYIAFILDLFYFLAVVYIPIYLKNLGMSWESIGLIFTFMLLPFVILPYPLGVIADKKTGEKELLIIALLILALTSGYLFFISSTNLYVWGIFLFLTRIGAASLEMLRDSYFYKKIDGRDVNIIDFFRTSYPAAYIAGSIALIIMLFFLPLKSIFIFAFLSTISGLWPAFALTDSKSEAEVK